MGQVVLARVSIGGVTALLVLRRDFSCCILIVVLNLDIGSKWSNNRLAEVLIVRLLVLSIDREIHPCLSIETMGLSHSFCAPKEISLAFLLYFAIFINFRYHVIVKFVDSR